MKMSKTESTTKHWCGTCGQLRKFLALAAEQIQKLPGDQKAEFRRDFRRQMGIPESDQEFLKRCGIFPDLPGED